MEDYGNGRTVVEFKNRWNSTEESQPSATFIHSNPDERLQFNWIKLRFGSKVRLTRSSSIR
jgi:hypothetical protein